MIEAEIKARVSDPGALHGLLGARCGGEASTYRDTYYDAPDGSLSAAGRELRLRVKEAAGRVRCVLTYKGPAVDEGSGSKPEAEVDVSDAGSADQVLKGLGFRHLVSFEKRCVNYSFRASGRDIMATVVTVPELDGTFLEVETMADAADVAPALEVVREVVAELGIAEADLTTELYTDAVMRRRGEALGASEQPGTY